MFIRKTVLLSLVFSLGFSSLPTVCMNINGEGLRRRKKDTVITVPDNLLPNYNVKKLSDITFDYNKEAYVPVGENGISIMFDKKAWVYIPENVKLRIKSNIVNSLGVYNCPKRIMKKGCVRVGAKDKVMFNGPFALKNISTLGSKIKDLRAERFKLILEEKNKPFFISIKRSDFCEAVLLVTVQAFLITLVVYIIHIFSE